MKRYFSSWIALAVGLVLTIVASLEVKKAIEQDAVDEIAFTSEQVTLKIRERLDAYALTLKGGAGIFAASNAVNRSEWQAYVEKLRAQDSLPGVQGIGFSLVIPPQQLAAHIARIRAEGFPDYTVRPAGERALYTSIIYLEPFRDRNLRAFGFDMFSEPVRRAAMEQACDSGAPALSGKVELVQETGTEVQAGTLMYVPVYRNGAQTDSVEQRRAALIGWSYSPYRMKDLLEGILTNWDDHKTKRVHLQIYTGLEVKADSLLYDNHPTFTHKIDQLLHQQRTIDFNGQHWLLIFQPSEGVVPISYVSAWVTLVGGIVLSSLLFGLMFALARTQVRAREIADNLSEELRKSERFLRSTIDGLSAHITVLDDQGGIILTNQAYRDFGARNGIDPGTVSEGANYLAVCDTASGEHSEEATPFAEGIREVLSGKSRSFELEYPCHSPSEERWFIAHVTPFDDEGPRQVIVAHENITERKRAEDALREQRDFSESLIETAPALVLVLDTQGRIVRFNPYMEKLVGYDLDEVKGMDWFETFLTPEISRTIKPLFQKAVDDIQTCGNVNPIITKDGRTIPVEWYDKTLKDKEGRTVGILAIGQDITGRKQARETREKLQAQITRTQKAESLGRMAGAIAHIFNNQLGVVIGNLEMALEDLPQDAQPVTKLDAAIQGARKAAEVSGLMLTYLGQTSGSNVPMDLSEFCRQSLPLLRAETSQNIVLNVNLPSPGSTIKANAKQIQQMLTNLVTNAREAVGEQQGMVTLSVKTVPQTDISQVHRYPTDWQAENAAYACLEVTDTGSGIASEAIDKIFDPFFSTKFTGRGLGLAVVLGIVKAHGGAITVESEIGKGSTFRVYLPESDMAISQLLHKTSTPLIKKGSGTILLVEDEEMMRSMAETMLTRLGFKVLIAKDGVEAVEVFEQYSNEIDVVLSDLTMPRMNGFETLAALRQIRPDIPVVLASGHDETKILRDKESEFTQIFLQKPYQKAVLKDTLTRAMRKVIQQEF